MLYKMVELKDGVSIQYVGVYILRWKQEWGEPTVGFDEADYCMAGSDDFDKESP